MEILGIICEYNPFHNGHAKQLEILRQRFGDNTGIIACMSGDFVQRGEPALMAKHLRAKAALDSGVNLVLELEAPFSCCSADYFAQAAVRALARTGLPLTLCFGSEAGNLRALKAMAALRQEEPAVYAFTLKEALEQGQSYAAAHAAAARTFVASPEAHTFFGAEEIELLRSEMGVENFFYGSNNQLGIAYLQACSELSRKQRPKLFTHKRLGSAYLDEKADTESGLSSATAIRQKLLTFKSSSAQSFIALKDEMPENSLAVLISALQKQELADLNLWAIGLITRIRTQTVSELELYHGWDEGLAERCKKIVSSRFSDEQDLWTALVQAARSKRFPSPRVQRAFSALALGLKKEEAKRLLEQGAPFYLRALAADKTGRYLLRRMRKSATVPIFTKASDYLEIPASETAAKRLAELAMAASDIHRLISGGKPAEDFDRSMYLR